MTHTTAASPYAAGDTGRERGRDARKGESARDSTHARGDTSQNRKYLSKKQITAFAQS